MIVQDFKKYSSPYLRGAYRYEGYMIKYMEIAENKKSFDAIVDIKKHRFCTIEKFHLSAIMASIVVQQLGVIYVFASENEEKVNDIYYLKESWKYKRQIDYTSGILFKFRDIKSRKSTMGVIFDCHVDISNGAFEGRCKILKPIV
ncbi:hypothetical protein P0136_12510 [Lentisphaerota bacterium ZTH]|nr:hypothetical protein JYG24_09975 [Lentisphaerota bacterium]WET06180.1 hypothetical protein P0136_12510 [Lentisphaerota bacterium ZTH]